MRICDYLKGGESAAIHLCDLCRITGSSATSVKAAIKRERLAGVPIISSVSGYWLGSTAAEVGRFARLMDLQGSSRLQVAAAVRSITIGGGDDG